MKHINEWNLFKKKEVEKSVEYQDSDIALSILKNLESLKPSDIQKLPDAWSLQTYKFNLKDFEVKCEKHSRTVMSDHKFAPRKETRYQYKIMIDGVKLDISNRLPGSSYSDYCNAQEIAKNIYNKVDEIYKMPERKKEEDKREEERFIKKDFRITFRENIKKFEDFTMDNGECDICGGPIFGDDICPNCENEDNIPEPDEDIKDKGNQYKDHSHYNSNVPVITRSQQNYFM